MARNTKSIVGKTIIGVITRPLGGDRESIVMLQFSDGTCFEFVSPRAGRLLSRMAADAHRSAAQRASHNARTQLSFFPQDGVTGSEVAPTAAAA